MYTLLRLISFVQQLLQFYLHSFLWKKILISLYAGINILCGIGLLTTPYAIKEGGWLSLIFLVIFAFFCCYTGVLLKECLESSPGLKTYPDIGQAAFGLAGRLGIAVSPIWIWNGQFLNKHACIYKHILNVVMYATYNKHDYHWACIYKQKPLLFGSLIDTWFCSNADIFVCRTICKCKKFFPNMYFTVFSTFSGPLPFLMLWMVNSCGLQASCVEYIIMMSDNLASLFPDTYISLAGIHLESHQVFAITSTLIVLPTVWLKNLSLLSYLSGFLSILLLSFIYF